MKKLLMSICILLILSFSLIDALADTADTDVSYSLSTNDNDKLEQMVTKNTASWEKIYGPHELWNYSLNAQYTSTFGTMAGGYNTSWLPVEPSDDALPFEDAVSIAKIMLAKQDNRFNDNYFPMLTVASSYIVADMPGTYFSRQGTWIIEFWSTLNNALQKISYVYIDAHTGNVPLMMIAIDQKAPDDYNHILVIENPS